VVTMINKEKESLYAALTAWEDKLRDLYHKPKTAHQFRVKFREIMNYYLVYSALNYNLLNEFQVYYTVMERYGTKLDILDLRRVLATGYTMQHLRKEEVKNEKDKFTLLQPGRRANGRLMNIMKKLVGYKDEFRIDSFDNIFVEKSSPGMIILPPAPVYDPYVEGGDESLDNNHNTTSD